MSPDAGPRTARACLVDVYRTLLEVDFVAHATQLLPMAGLPPDHWDTHFSPLADAVNRGELTLREAFGVGLENAGVEPTDALLTAMVERDRQMFDEHTHVYEDSLPFLEHLHARGIPIAVVSNCAENTRPMLDRTGISALVDVLVLSCEVRSAKPDAAIYLHAVDALGVVPEEALFVDDQPAYCTGAGALGIQAVRIERDGAPWFDDPVGTADGSVTVVASLTDVLHRFDDV